MIVIQLYDLLNLELRLIVAIQWIVSIRSCFLDQFRSYLNLNLNTYPINENGIIDADEHNSFFGKWPIVE